MKKILCFTLAFLLSFNAITCNVLAEDFSGSSTDYNIPSKDTLKELPIDAPQATESFLKNVYFQPMTEYFNALGIDIWGDNKVWNEDTSKFIVDNVAKDNNVTTDGNYYYINANFIKNINEKVQENIHALDGYYLIEPSGEPPFLNGVEATIRNYLTLVANFKNNTAISSDTNVNTLLNFTNRFSFVAMSPYKTAKFGNGVYDSYYILRLPYSGFDSAYNLYIDGRDNIIRLADEDGTKQILSNWCDNFHFSSKGSLNFSYHYHSFSLDQLKTMVWYGSPFRVFYSLEDIKRFKVKGGRQYFAPKLPFSNIRIPVTYINNINSSGLPNFNFNTGSLVGKAEADVQADIDLALKNYLDHLIELNNTKPAPTSTPTPTKAPIPTKAPTNTPAPVTPITVTPTPVLPNVTVTPTPPPEDFSSINKWLEQIYNWLLDFGDKNQTFTEKICKYIDSTDGKLDQIIEAIDRLSQGDTTGEANGCKYDYTALSEFMTQLWNESDKKFDKMVKLLEENNEYQQKIVDSLNQIKALLVADTVLDVFRNRSNETANKAKEKFPTSLPWDIALVVNAFSAPPKEPVIELPIKIESMHIDEKIVVDLSSEEWVKLAKTCRYLLSILFVLYMVHLSRKFFSKGDD